MKHPEWVLFTRAGPAGAENCPLRSDDLRLNKKIAERRVQGILCRRGEDDFRVTRNVDGPTRPGAVGDGDSAQLDVVLRRDSDFRMRVDFMGTATKLRSRFRENRFITLRSFKRRLVRG
jgi:hypothetical protein